MNHLDVERVIGHARTRSVNGHAIGLGIDACRKHERAIIHKHLDRRDIADNAHVTNLVDGLPTYSTTAAGRSAALIGKSHLKTRGQFSLGGYKRQLQLAINSRGKRAVDTVNNNVKAGIAGNLQQALPHTHRGIMALETPANSATSFIFTTRATPVIEIAFTMRPLRATA